MNKEILNSIIKGEVCGIIPARAGSKGVRNKNIRMLKGYPMIAYSIAAAAMCPEISRTIVSTDSPDYAEIAKRYGGEAPFLRPAELAEDASPDIGFMVHAIEWLYEKEGRVPEFFAHLRPTYPLRDISIMSEAVKKMKADPSATSLRSAYLATNTPYKWFQEREGYFQSILSGQTLDEANNPRQAFPDVFIPDSHIDILRTSFIVEKELMHGDRMIAYKVPLGVDIDAAKDIDYLDYYMEEHPSPVYDYLRRNYEKVVS